MFQQWADLYGQTYSIQRTEYSVSTLDSVAYDVN